MNLVFSKKVLGLVFTASSLLGLSSQASAYCSSQGNNVSYEWVNRVSVNGQTNVSGSDGGYGSYVGVPITLDAGSNAIELVPGFRSSSYTEHWRVWVDINQNNSYESNELVFSGRSRSAVSGSIELPAGAFTGDTGMRVSMRYGGYPAPCGSYTYGEVEDYVVSMLVLDSEPPIVTVVEPQPNQLSIPTNSSIMVTFNEPIDTSIDLNLAFNVSDDQGEIGGLISSAGQSITFTPDSDLKNDTLYNVEVSSLITDLAGNPLTTAYNWQFTTDKAQDTLAPQVQTISPMMDEQDVAINSAVSVVFSEAIDASTVTSSSFKVSRTGMDVPGQLSSNGTVVLFEPNAPLDYEASYMVTLSNQIADLAGNSLEANVSWGFNTGIAPDTIAPVIVSTNPSDLTQGVSVNSAVVANFSEAMNATSLNPATFTLSNGSQSIEGMVTTENGTATFSPSEPLEYGTSYFATVTVDAMDLAGNSLESPLNWQFSTENGYSISGAVLDNGVGLENVTVVLSGELDAQVTTDVNGFFSFANLAPGSYLVTPNATGYQFDLVGQATDVVDVDISNIEFNASIITTLNVPTEYASIQLALDSAADGATILVDDGVYTENLVIDKSVTVESVNGYQVTSVVSSTGGNVFWVNAPNVTIKGFDTYGATTFGRAGIYFNEGAHNGRALDNRCGYDDVHRNHSGIRIIKSDNMDVSGNLCQVNGLYGIRAELTNGSKFSNNVMEQQSFEGIYLLNSNNNQLTGNTTSGNRWGISIRTSSFNTLENNLCTENSEDGIKVFRGSDNSVLGSTCNNNDKAGVFISESSNAIADSNEASSNGVSGIVFYKSNQATAKKNVCNSNSDYGLYINNSDFATVDSNTCNLNGARGFRLNFADQNTITNNQFNFQRFGVEFNSSNDNLFVGNTVKSKISGVKGCEIQMRSSSNNTLFQNSFISYTVEDVCSNNGSVTN